MFQRGIWGNLGLILRHICVVVRSEEYPKAERVPNGPYEELHKTTFQYQDFVFKPFYQDHFLGSVFEHGLSGPYPGWVTLHAC